ncbi:MAG TPA: penicillin-binding transpeptidase domain-containing protein, partial [Candidatus Methylomirabilis sp.]|nr:penicillin-binding transpeptidase domain-containing protein [Candidatus Methylomirabilis sp.]
KVRGIAPFFVEYIRKELESRYGQVRLTRGGLQIFTTLNLDMQRAAIEVMRQGLAEIEKGRMAKRKTDTPQAALEGALVALDPKTGQIRVMVGGRDYTRSQFNRATQARRQPGSAFKPIVYAAAFEHGFAPTTVMDDYPVTYSIPKNGRMVEWRPENFDHQFRGQVTLRRALEESINIPTVLLLDAVGIDPIVSLAYRMGIISELRREYGLALGTSEVSLLELTSAYGVLANQGIRVAPSGVRRVTGANGDVLELSEDVGERVLSEEAAFLVTSLLEGAVERGTAKRASVPGRNVAAKTGTSQDAMDVWLVGYVPRLVAGVWAGYDQPRSLGSQESAGRLIAPVWAEFMRSALQDVPSETVPIPEGVFSASVNYRTGLLSERGDPEAITEYFVRGPAEGPSPLPGLSPLPSPTSLLPEAQPLAPEPEGASQR